MRLLLLAEVSLALIVGTGLLCSYFLISNPSRAQATTLAPGASAHATKPSPATTTNQQWLTVTAPNYTGSQTTIAPEQTCQRGTSPTLAPLSLTTAQPGLTQVIDNTNHYTVYGTTTQEIDNQMYNCSPVVINDQVFAASTNYLIDSQYNYVSAGNGTCRLSNVAVGLHVDQIFPDWQGDASANPNMPGIWQRFITNLTTHEQGHINLDIRYANQILEDLQNLPAVPCATIGSAVHQAFTNDLNALNEANNQYDADTYHGLTQGAIL